MQLQHLEPISFLQYVNDDNSIGIKLEQTLSRMEESYHDQVSVLDSNIRKLHGLIKKNNESKKFKAIVIPQVN